MIVIKNINEYDLKVGDLKTPVYTFTEKFIEDNFKDLAELAENPVLKLILHDLNAINIQRTMNGVISIDKGQSYSEMLLTLEKIINTSIKPKQKKDTSFIEKI